MMSVIVFAILVLLLIGGLYLVWSFWWSYNRVNPEDEAFQHRVALLNNDQSYRMSDHQIANPPAPEDAWAQMVRQGLRRRRQQQVYRTSRTRYR